MLVEGGPNICGVTIGVLCLDSRFPKLPGHIKNVSGLPFPVLYETVRGATVAQLINEPSDQFIHPFIDAAQRLEVEGVRAITGSCGFLALYQRELAEAVSVPVFASSLIQVPLVHNMLRPGQKVGVLTASAARLTEAHFRAVGAAGIPVAIGGLENSEEFCEVILEGQRSVMNVTKIEQEVLGAAQSLVDENPEIGALVLECTDMPTFAHRIQARLRLPVFDLTTLATMVHDAVARMPYQGLWPRQITPDPDSR
ncbi:MAG: aspartate/glutamate racemase family protein [Pseudomonadota bacterium]